jgi:leishmanolysin-like peptidase
MKSCKSWIDAKSEANESIRPFCNNIPNLSEWSPSKYECNSNRDAVLLCNIMRYQGHIPRNYRNFDSTHHQNHLHHDSSTSEDALSNISNNLGGSVVLADYCPFMQQVSWSINNEIRDSKCSFEENRPDEHKNYILEEYGHESKCFLHNSTWQIYSDKCQSRITVSKTIGCYSYTCDANQGLLVRVNGQLVRCEYAGQVVEFKIRNKLKKKLTVHFGNLICPSCEEICQNQIKCPSQDHIKTISQRNSNDSKETRKDSIVKSTSSNSAENDNHHRKSSFSSFLNSQHEYCLKQMIISRATKLESYKFVSILVYLISNFKVFYCYCC